MQACDKSKMHKNYKRLKKMIKDFKINKYWTKKKEITFLWKIT